MRKLNLSKKSYFIAFLIVMLVNVGLAIFLINSVMAQTSETSFKDQKPITVEVEQQKNCPIQINVSKVDNDALSYQSIFLKIKNTGAKPIRAFTLLIYSKRGGKVITSSYATKPFQIGKTEAIEEAIERPNITNDNQIFSLSFDYIEFVDGSSWGNDTQKKSTLFAAQREGRKSAIKKFRDLIKNLNASDVNNLGDIINKNLTETDIDTSNFNQSDEWKRAFRLGYRSVFSILQRVSDKSVENLTQQLNELEKMTVKED